MSEVRNQISDVGNHRGKKKMSEVRYLMSEKKSEEKGKMSEVRRGRCRKSEGEDVGNQKSDVRYQMSEVGNQKKRGKREGAGLN